jgi:hypothetical protein
MGSTMPEENISNREVGAALQELAEVRHDYRNLRTIVYALDEEQDRLRLELAKTKIAIRTAIGVISAAIGVIGWLIDFIYRNSI